MLGPLQTMESLKCGWPYLSQKMLDFQTKTGSNGYVVAVSSISFLHLLERELREPRESAELPGNRESGKARMIVRYWSGSERKNLMY
ncbi:hypothetical protein E4U58_005852 [Claviceps cyperi]|nr:hypothetical protein E4U58_005852 [Claviceps cyperi]